MREEDKPTCPKCGGKMRANGHTPKGKQRWICYGDGTRYGAGAYCHTTTNPGAQAAVDRQGNVDTAPKVFKRALGKAKKFVITSAQNATPANAEFLESLEGYCKRNDAELVVIPIRYRNPTSVWSESQQDAEWWDEKVVPYLCNQRKKLCENLVLLGDIKTTPTAEMPLSGFEGITHGESGILGHSKMQLRSIPTPSHKLPKIMVTTGSVTKPNYTDTKAGKKGEFHHVFGAIVVEIVGKKFHMRQINACKDGSFIDWDTEYVGDQARPAARAAALVMGDSHFQFMDPDVGRATFGKDGIIEQLAPEKLVWHDVLDGYSRNPHHEGNPFAEIAKLQHDMADVEKEVLETTLFIREQTQKHNCESVIVPSNHDDFLRRWIMNTDWRRDPLNAEFYLETALVMVKSVRMGPGGTSYVNPFTHWVKTWAGGSNIRCLGMNDSCMVKGIEVGMHGHKGPNGARGTLRNLSQIGVKSVTGHSHQPGIINGAYQVGTSSRLDLEYAEGPSSWIHGHVVIYANGKRSHVFIIDGKFKA